jgi:threonine dehydrogenase-like Zn-dependent dehydrogenase
MLGAERVIAIDSIPERLQMAKEGRAEVVNYQGIDVVEMLKQMTGGIGPDACIDSVGMEAHGTTIGAINDTIKQKAHLATDRPHALREAIQACRKGGIVSCPGVYAGFLDKVPFGSAFAKALTFKTGQTHVHKYLRPLLNRIRERQIDPSFVITHRFDLNEAPHGYDIFQRKEDGCIKVVLKV